MKGKAIALLILAGLCLATSAMAVDLNKRATGQIPAGTTGFTLDANFTCDNNSPSSAWFQADNQRFGNVFTFPAGSQLSRLEFVHFGFSTLVGPYNYDLELWDPTTCTLINTANGLSAANAFSTIQTEIEDLCARNLFASGTVAVTVDANSCFDPTDCYPDVLYDDNLFVVCPIIVDVPTVTCLDVSDQAGPFMLRVDYDTCPPTSTVPSSWGKVKSLYR